VELTGESIIGYRRGGKSGEPFRAFDPAAGEALAQPFYSASQAEVDEAVKLAAASFRAYRDLTARKRGAFLRRIAGYLEELGDVLVERATRETALPAARIRGEQARTANQLRFFAEVIEEGSWVDARIDHGDPSRRPVPKPDVRSMLEPLGPVAVFGASNFPLAFSVAGGDTASALAAGNPVIALAHYSHPGTAELAGMAIRNAAAEQGLPEGVFSLLFDGTQAVGKALVEHPALKAVGFTGSRAGGTALGKLAASRPEPIPFYAEMSSVNPVFVLPGVLESRAETLAKGLHASVTLAVGQFCTNPGIVVTMAPADEFASKLAALMKQTAPEPMLNRKIAAAYRQSVSQRTANPQVRLWDGEPDEAQTASNQSGKRTDFCGARPALFETDAATFASQPDLQAEIFGPSTLLVSARNREDLLNVARRMEGNLTATIHGTEQDLLEFADLIAILETKVGRIIFNGFPTGVEVCNAMVHGGTYPSTSDGRSTSVGGRAILRFVRPVAYQDFPESALPPELRDGNPLGIWRQVDGMLSR
jgi:alpha-ketoglutaric semialdehyde dehydrogenase